MRLNQRFPGQYYDFATGLVDNRARTYDPQIGAFVQSDPLGLAAGPSTYAYGFGNPISLSDPTGLCSVYPCTPQDMGNAPSPNVYIAIGSIAGSGLGFPPFGPIAFGTISAEFHRGFPLDAQGLYGSSPAYANYAYGLYMGSAGLTLGEALFIADVYGSYANYSSFISQGGVMSDVFTNIPVTNVEMITQAFSDLAHGTVCH